MKIFNRPVAIIGKIWQPKKSVTAASGAATLNEVSGVITSEALTTVLNAAYTLTLTNSQVKATDVVIATIQNGTNSAATPVLSTVAVADGSIVFKIYNKHDSAVAFNGTLKVAFQIIGQLA